ncbi:MULTISPECIES: hypothetical protein [Rahnella]|uniref:hypothetical protein n=1 Tax=Rahnella TaxID=34037 RepID=UPI003F6DF370
MTDTPHTAAQGFNFDAFMYGVRRDSPFDGSTLADSISNDEVRRAESAFNSLLKRAEKAEAELAALKGEQVPVAWLNDAHLARGHIEGEAGEEDAGPGMIPVYRERFSAPQKPVVLPKSHYICGCADRYMSEKEVKAAIEAAGGIVFTSDERLMQDMSGIVKDGE